MYKNTEILDYFRECYALEKIHGTSAHVQWKVDDSAPEGRLILFSGGEKYEKFAALWDHKELAEKFKAFGSASQGEGITLYGEAYGGKQQGMSATYGPNLKFIVFEVKIGDLWLDVTKAEKVALDMGFEFVHFVRGPATLEFLNAQRDADSVQAIRNGMGPGHMREGVVVRPLIELTKNNGSRLMVKHKRDDFRETAAPREIGREKLEVLTQAREISNEWVTEMRLEHVLSKLAAQGVNIDSMSSTGQVVKAMVEDVRVEGEGEMIWNNDVAKAIGTETARLYKQRVTHIRG